MRITTTLLAFARAWILVPAIVTGELLSNAAAQPADARFVPYAADPEHPWNRLHQALFVRERADGGLLQGKLEAKQEAGAEGENETRARHPPSLSAKDDPG